MNSLIMVLFFGTSHLDCHARYKTKYFVNTYDVTTLLGSYFEVIYEVNIRNITKCTAGRYRYMARLNGIMTNKNTSSQCCTTCCWWCHTHPKHNYSTPNSDQTRQKKTEEFVRARKARHYCCTSRYLSLSHHTEQTTNEPHLTSPHLTQQHTKYDKHTQNIYQPPSLRLRPLRPLSIISISSALQPSDIYIYRVSNG